MKKTLILALSFSAVLSGCSNTSALEQQVNTLSNKVDKLTTEVSKLKRQQENNNDAVAELEKKQSELNKRMDNVAKTYKK